MSSQSSPTSTPDFSSFCWGGDSESTGTPKSDTADKIQARKDRRHTRRRIVRACMRCRIRKTKCDGGKPCTRCTEADDVCEYMKCSKKESKEYSQDYVERLLEQNDKYKTAMRLLYANRRLSIQPDSISIPSMGFTDGALVHDILEHLGLLGGDSVVTSTSGSALEREGRQILKATQTSSVSSTPSLNNNGIASPEPMFSQNLENHTDICSMPDFDFHEIDTSLDTGVGLNFPYEAYSSINSDLIDVNWGSFTPDLSLPQNVSAQDWCPLEALGDVMNMPAGQFWINETSRAQYT